MANRSFFGRNPSVQPEAVASKSRGSHETLGSGIFFSAIFIIPFIFDEKPDGTLILSRHSKKIFFSALVGA